MRDKIKFSDLDGKIKTAIIIIYFIGGVLLFDFLMGFIVGVVSVY